MFIIGTYRNILEPHVMRHTLKIGCGPEDDSEEVKLTQLKCWIFHKTLGVKSIEIPD